MKEKHTGVKNVNYDYSKENCILNATDIMMDEMMYSVPAMQIWAGLANAQDKTAKLDTALKAMEDAMTLFYHHKGLSDSAGTAMGNNALPSQHLISAICGCLQAPLCMRPATISAWNTAPPSFPLRIL